MDRNKRQKRLICAAAGAAAWLVFRQISREKQRKNEERLAAIDAAVINNRDYGSRRAHLIGGGLSALSAAAYLIRDCHFPGKQIVIYEKAAGLGGRWNRGVRREDGLVCPEVLSKKEAPGENFVDLFDSIPALSGKKQSVWEELRTHILPPEEGKMAILGKNGIIRADSGKGLKPGERIALIRLLLTDEKRLDNRSAEDWFQETPHLFETPFWSRLQAEASFRRTSSLLEVRRYLLGELSARSRFPSSQTGRRLCCNPYDSLIRPLVAWLRREGVLFLENCEVTDLEFAASPARNVKALYLKSRLQEENPQKESFDFRKIELSSQDLCIMTADLGGDRSYGDLTHPPQEKTGGLREKGLWERLTEADSRLGEAEPFLRPENRGAVLSFTVTCRGEELLEEILGRTEGRRSLFLKDSPWMIRMEAMKQPFGRDQNGEIVLWGRGLAPEAEGSRIKKPMKECSGREILRELLFCLGVAPDRAAALEETVIQVIPVYEPYGAACLLPRKYIDRISPTEGSGNFAMIGALTEVSGEVSLGEEQAVRSGRMAVYRLLDVRKRAAERTVITCPLKLAVKALLYLR